MKLCINCDSENPADAVFCSECGMSLTRAATHERQRSTQNHDTEQRWEKRVLRGMLVVLGLCWTMVLVPASYCLWFAIKWNCAEMPCSATEMQRNDLAAIALACGLFGLAIAPWIALFLIRWRRSRTPAPPQVSD